MNGDDWILSSACGSGVHCADCPYGVGAQFEIVGFTPKSPSSLLARARRLCKELRRWQRAGYRLVSGAERRRRLRLCQACAHYAPMGNLGFGLCRLCGCTRAKLWLASAKCPHPNGARWGAQELGGPTSALTQAWPAKAVVESAKAPPSLAEIFRRH